MKTSHLVRRFAFAVVALVLMAMAQRAYDQTLVSTSVEELIGDLHDVPSAQDQAASSANAAKKENPVSSIFPTFNSYDASMKLNAQTARQKMMVGFGSSFGPSGFLFSGAKAGINQTSNAYPAFRQGTAGYGRYYWHAFADQAGENLTVQSILPLVLKQDSRYYTLGDGGVPKRTVYVLSRVLITRHDKGADTFNASEIIGAGAAAGISTTYYPGQHRTWTKTGQRWLSNVLVDGGFMVVREFWPDVSRKLFGRH